MPRFDEMTPEQVAARRAVNKAYAIRRALAAGLPLPKPPKPARGKRKAPFRPPPKAKPEPAPVLGPMPAGLNDPARRIALAARGMLPMGRLGFTPRPRGSVPPGHSRDRAAEETDAYFGQRAAARAAHDLGET